MPRKGPWSSGFCGPRMPDDSHRRCHGSYRDLPCSCPCHIPKHCPTCTCKENA